MKTKFIFTVSLIITSTILSSDSLFSDRDPYGQLVLSLCSARGATSNDANTTENSSPQVRLDATSGTSRTYKVLIYNGWRKRVVLESKDDDIQELKQKIAKVLGCPVPNLHLTGVQVLSFRPDGCVGNYQYEKLESWNFRDFIRSCDYNPPYHPQYYINARCFSSPLRFRGEIVNISGISPRDLTLEEFKRTLGIGIDEKLKLVEILELDSQGRPKRTRETEVVERNFSKLVDLALRANDPRCSFHLISDQVRNNRY